jgi:uncharacterized protein DUF4058
MSNPFPGMDPYLEGPLWNVVHRNLIDELARQLMTKLPDRYLALTEERVVLATLDPIEWTERQVRYPDVGVYHDTVETLDEGTAAASATTTAPLVLEAVMPESLTQPFIEIRDGVSRELVASIEVLSPTNKRGDGLAKYQERRRELLAGPAHFIEIDLLRIGERFPVTTPLPSVPYFVFLSRANRRPRVETWPIALDQPLPTIPIPLLTGDSDILLDIQLAFQTIYRLFKYHRAADHSGAPRAPLSPEQATWAEERLRLTGLR